MKKILSFNGALSALCGLSLLCVLCASCEDVPEPYVNPYQQITPSGPEIVVEPAGDGTRANPWNVAALLEACNGLAADAFLMDGAEVYVAGVVVETTEVSSQFGNATYYISDTKKASNKFYVFRGKLLDGKSVESESDLQVGDSVVVCGKVKNYKGNTLEFDQGNYLVFYQKGEGGSDTPGGDTPSVETVGTKDAPKTVEEAVAAINAMADNATSSEFWYVTGKVIRVTTTQANFEKYGNLNYIISADGTEATTQMTIYSGDGLDGAKFSGIDALKQGDEVVVYGQLQKYVNANSGAMTPEMAKGNYLVKLNSNGGGTTPTPSGDAKGSGTASDPFNAIAAINYTVALGADVTSTDDIYVKGKISSIKFTFSAQYGTATFNISEDGQEANVFTAYSCYYLGNRAWVDGDTQISVGDEVVVCGKVVYYGGNTPEFASKKNYLVSLNATTEGGGSVTPPSGGDVAETGDNGDFEQWADGLPVNWTTTSTAGNATLEQSTNARNGSYSVKVNGFTGKTNKRIGYKEIRLSAGTYLMKFYAKGLAEGGTVRPGVVPVTDGRAGTYKYSSYVDGISTTSWQLVEAELTVDVDGTYSFVIMNQAKEAGGIDILIDDFTVTLGDKTVIR